VTAGRPELRCVHRANEVRPANKERHCCHAGLVSRVAGVTVGDASRTDTSNRSATGGKISTETGARLAPRRGRGDLIHLGLRHGQPERATTSAEAAGWRESVPVPRGQPWGPRRERPQGWCISTQFRHRDVLSVSPSAVVCLSDAAPVLGAIDLHREGAEMAQHAQLRSGPAWPSTSAIHSPWQRGTNKLLPQYFPKGTDPAKHSLDDLEAVAAAQQPTPQNLGWNTKPKHKPTSSSRIAWTTRSFPV
jgi:hypothetical protein